MSLKPRLPVVSNGTKPLLCQVYNLSVDPILPPVWSVWMAQCAGSLLL